MTPKTKTFDCVEMKRRVQEKLLAEYQARRSEFESYSQFIEAKSRSSARHREFWARVHGGERA
jgi:hypothetical protein